MTGDDKKNLLDLLWKMYNENTTYARHHETQRSTVTNLILILAGATMTLVGLDKAVTLVDLPASVFLIILGLFGAIFSEQHFARAKQHIERSKYYRASIDSLLPPLNDVDLSGIRGFVLREMDNFINSEIDEKKKKFINEDINEEGVLTAIKRAAEMAYIRKPKKFISAINPGSFHLLWTGIHLIVLVIGVVLGIVAICFPGTPSK